jgi:hypothetical protein
VFPSHTISERATLESKIKTAGAVNINIVRCLSVIDNLILNKISQRTGQYLELREGRSAKLAASDCKQDVA